MDQDFLDAIQGDCEILLRRALHGKTVNAFGVDGNGLWGSDYHAHQYRVNAINVLVDPSSSISDPRAVAYITLEGYDFKDHGFVATDNNLHISMNARLSEELIDTTCWTWASAEAQGADYFAINLDVNRLMNW